LPAPAAIAAVSPKPASASRERTRAAKCSLSSSLVMSSKSANSPGAPTSFVFAPWNYGPYSGPLCNSRYRHCLVYVLGFLNTPRRCCSHFSDWCLCIRSIFLYYPCARSFVVFEGRQRKKDGLVGFCLAGARFCSPDLHQLHLSTYCRESSHLLLPYVWHHEDRAPTHGYAETREGAMAAFAKSWRPPSSVCPKNALWKQMDEAAACGRKSPEHIYRARRPLTPPSPAPLCVPNPHGGASLFRNAMISC
jgi:hypothetical protein